jgi:tetratricopeptide (TPR) repeat protein
LSRSFLTVLALASCTAPTEAGRKDGVDEARGLQRRLAEDPTNAETHVRLGLLWARSGDGLRAQHYLERAYELGADARRTLPPLIRVSLALANWEAALRHAGTLAEHLRSLCAGEPTGPVCREMAEVLVTLAELHKSLGDPGRALLLLQEATRLRPAFADAYVSLARLHDRQRSDPDAARTALRRGITALRGQADAELLRRSLAILESRKGAP